MPKPKILLLCEAVLSDVIFKDEITAQDTRGRLPLYSESTLEIFRSYF